MDEYLLKQLVDAFEELVDEVRVIRSFGGSCTPPKDYLEGCDLVIKELRNHINRRV